MREDPGFVSPAVRCGGATRDFVKLCTRRRRFRRRVSGDVRRRRLCCTLDAAQSGGDDGNLSTRIAKAFVNACTPTGIPYAEAVQQFVRYALEAYKTGYSLSALRLELRGNVDTARALASDEAELRDVWLSLVYKTLRAVRYPGGAGRELMAPDNFDAFVKSVVAARRDGLNLNRIQKVQESGDGKGLSELEQAILRQSTRLVVATIDVVDEDL